jgi:hypothetical protein
MDTLAGIARQRAVMTTIADVIVAAAEGRSLRVAVAGGHRDGVAFADHLTQALHARGRDCRCHTSQHGPALAADHVPPVSESRVHAVAVITSAVAGLADSDVCRIDIQVNTGSRQLGSSGLQPRRDPEDRDVRARDDDHAPDIVVNYLDLDGPIIGHLGSWLALLDPR